MEDTIESSIEETHVIQEMDDNLDPLCVNVSNLPLVNKRLHFNETH